MGFLRLSLSILIAGLVSLMFCGGKVVFATGYAYGNDSSVYDGGIVNYDCYGTYGWNRCPQWVLVDKSVYQTILNNNRLDGTYSGLGQCNSDAYTVIAGYVKNSVGQIWIRNLNKDITPSKTGHRLLGIATSANNINTTNYGTDENVAVSSRGFLGEKAGTYNGKDITFGEMIYLITQQNGVSEKNLAAFCMSMLEEQAAYYGKAEVQDGTTINDSATTTGWKNVDTRVIRNINCAASGCKAVFELRLGRTGSGSTQYILSRWSNHPAISNETSGALTQNFSSGNDVKVWHHEVVLYPGQVVCEKIAFYKDNNKGAATVQACASALGEENTNVSMKVKNNSVDRYNNYTDTVYAMPGNSTTYLATYQSGLQYAYYLIPPKMQIDGGTIYPTSNYNTTNMMGVAFNYLKSSNLRDWNNGFVVGGDNLNYLSNITYDIGDYSAHDESNNHTVTVFDVGKELKETAATNVNDATKTTPSRITFSSDSNKNNVSNVITSAKEDSASVIVPYNFSNTTTVSSTSDDKTVFAGEEKWVKVDFNVEKKYNSLFNASYATIVPNATWKLRTCYGDRCEESTGTTDLNTSRSLDGGTTSEWVKIDVPDEAAGTQVCVQSEISPISSGADTNYLSSGFDENSAVSGWECFTVAKKPSFQAWGGNVYTNGGINTYTSEKQINGKNYSFGSWAELGVIASGKVSGFSSGASLSYINNTEQRKTGFCARSLLTFANSNCSNSESSAGEIGTDVLTSGVGEDAISKLIENGNGVHVVDADNDGHLAGMTIYDSGITVVDSRGRDLIIDGDLTYANGSGYGSFDEMPVLIIYANNIKINCDVSRIDALLIAEGVVNTCVNGDGITPDVDEALRSRQLTINGAILANNIELNRTYGARTGFDSAVPAEIINFDPILYMISSPSSSDAEASVKFTTTYLHELSPRY